MTGIWGFVAVNFQWRAAVQHQYIQPAIPIEICKRGTAPPFGTGQTGGLTHFPKGAIRLLHQKIIGIFDRIGWHLIHIAFGDEQVGTPVIVHIAKLRMPACRRAPIIAQIGAMRIGSDRKRSVAIGAVKLGHLHQLVAHGGEHDLFAPIAGDVAAGDAHAPDRDFFPAV